MSWQLGKIKLDDGTVYPAQLLLKENGEVWNVRILKNNKVVEEIDADHFAKQLGKTPEDVYPFTYELD